MEAAFLAGLVDLARRETGDELIAIPLRQTIVALLRAKGEAGE